MEAAREGEEKTLNTLNRTMRSVWMGTVSCVADGVSRRLKNEFHFWFHVRHLITLAFSPIVLNLAGINVTAFTKTMLEQRRLDTCLYDAIVKRMPAGKLPEDKDMLVAAGFTAFNSIYGETGGTGVNIEAAGRRGYRAVLNPYMQFLLAGEIDSRGPKSLVDQ